MVTGRSGQICADAGPAAKTNAIADIAAGPMTRRHLNMTALLRGDSLAGSSVAGYTAFACTRSGRDATRGCGPGGAAAQQLLQNDCRQSFRALTGLSPAIGVTRSLMPWRDNRLP